ncbi:LysR family transcriptional regulator [Endozoicomonas gorgoniicola]|uniref:LysR family transcriptional regulator n=1 Tax=Endozoicomonas gorgoniicola TaxID=1234144 RepID=A0ABT3MPW3_9GAMM|nr:LysR family transcriptional regulator [Endozoicomonas gorgoniicola]MCW7551401.1 LysR family transcriptional regulator [Endozoicomonas gorgoniicola]
MNTQANLNLLRVFYSLLNTKSTVSTAKALNVTQPAVSKQLNQLRELLQDPLIFRYGSSNGLTPKAESLRGLVSETVGNLNTLFEGHSFDLLSSDIHLNIATNSAIIRGWLAGIIGSLHQEAPNLSVNFVPISEHVEKGFNKGLIDLYIGPLPIKADIPLEIMEVITQPVRCFMPKKHPLALSTDPGETLSVDDLKKYAFTNDRAGFSNTDECGKYFKQLGVTPKEAFSLMEGGSALTTIKSTSTLLIGAYELSPEFHRDNELTSRALPGNVPLLKVGLVWPKYKNACSKHSWFRKRFIELWNRNYS